MDSSTWISLLSVVIAMSLATLQIVKAVKEGKVERRKQLQARLLAEDNADVRRDTLIVTNSEQAVAVLGTALRAAQDEITRRDARIAKLETERDLDRARIDTLETRIRQLERLTALPDSGNLGT